MRINEILTEAVRQRLDPKCWKGKHKEGTKIKGGVRVNNCVPNEDVAEDRPIPKAESGKAVALSNLGKFHAGVDTLGKWVPERLTHQFALDPNKWEHTFYSLTLKEPKKIRYYRPKNVDIVPGTLVGDMAIANQFYRTKDPAEQEQYALAYLASLKPYPVNLDDYEFPELLIPRKEQGVAEGQGEQDYLSQVPNLTWKPVSRSVWDTIQDEGLDEEQDAPKHTDWIMASLIISSEDARALQAFDSDVIEDFNRFDIHLKSRHPGLTDLIDYDNGTVTIVKPSQMQGVAEGLQNIEIQDDKSIVTISVGGKERFVLQPATGNKPKSYGGRAYKYWTIYDIERKKDRFNPNIGMMSKNQAIAYVNKIIKHEEDTAKEKQGVAEDWNKVNHHDKTDGLSQKAVNAYRREHPGSKLKTAVTTKPSKLKAGSKDAKRRKSFCARMSGNKGPMKDEHGKPTPKAKALKRWNC